MQIFGPFHLSVVYPDTTAEIITGLLAGRIAAVGFVLHGSSGDFTIATEGADGVPSETILEYSASNDIWIYPRPLLQDTSGSDTTEYDHVGVPVYDSINIAVANATDGDEFDVVFLVD